MNKPTVYIILLFSVQQLLAQQTICRNALQQVSQDSLVQFVYNLTGRNAIAINGVEQKIRSRFAFHPDNVLAGNYVKATCEAYGFMAEDIPYSSTGRNMVMYKEGKVNPKQAFILCAHYDCVGSATTNFQGADDNASGVAALLEAARVFSDVNFPYTLVLAFWDEEEIGLLGSNAFAPDGPLGYWDVKGVINLDMIGYDGNNDSLGMIHTFPVGNSVMLASKLLDVKSNYGLHLQTTVKNPGETATDHQSFWIKGATAVGLTEDYDADFSPHWHLLSDSIENMDLPYFTEMSKWAIAAICEIAQSGSVVAVGNIESQLFIQLYPNPVNEVLIVTLNVTINDATATIYNAIGTQLYAKKISGNQAIFDTRGLSSGFYFLTIASNDVSTKQRFIKTE